MEVQEGSGHSVMLVTHVKKEMIGWIFFAQRCNINVVGTVFVGHPDKYITDYPTVQRTGSGQLK